LVYGLPDPFSIGALHGDAIEELPPSACWLAQSDQYPHQAFRARSRSWGVQFHPEVSVATMRISPSCMERDKGGGIDELDCSADEFDLQHPAVQRGTVTMAHRFSGLIGSTEAELMRSPLIGQEIAVERDDRWGHECRRVDSRLSE
jgi:GMP synthase (glutamine-hydrolysing)